MPITFDATKEELDLIQKIANRAYITYPIYDNLLSANLDIAVCHCNGNPLRLQDLLDAPISDFCHDVIGIHVNVCRESGMLMNGFSPRFTDIERMKKEAEAVK